MSSIHIELCSESFFECEALCNIHIITSNYHKKNSILWSHHNYIVNIIVKYIVTINHGNFIIPMLFFIFIKKCPWLNLVSLMLKKTSEKIKNCLRGSRYHLEWIWYQNNSSLQSSYLKPLTRKVVSRENMKHHCKTNSHSSTHI